MKKNLFFVLSSNIINVIIGILIGFILPNILSIEGFGYYRLFILYSGYVGFFHFGFIDGIYLKYGSFNYEDIHPETFRTYTFYLFLQQVVISALFIIGSYFLFRGDRQFVFILVSINLILLNIITYFNFLSQIFENFGFNSLLSIFIKLLNLMVIVVFLVLKLDNYVIMNISITLLNVISLVISIWYYRKITFGKRKKMVNTTSDIKELYKLGFPLMIGNFIGMLVVGFDAFVVDNLFDIDLFSTYSFAISLTSILLIFVSSVSSVLYPYLSRVSQEEYQGFYSKLANLSTYVSTLGLASFFVLKFIIEAFIPKYVDSIMIFVFLLPAFVLRCFLSIVTTNYFKILKMQKQYLLNNVIAFLISAVVFTVVLFINKSILFVSVAYLLSHLLWFIYSDYYFSKKYNKRFIKRYYYTIVMFFLYFVSIQFSNLIGFTLYLSMYFITTFLFFRKEVKVLLKEKTIIPKKKVTNSGH